MRFSGSSLIVSPPGFGVSHVENDDALLAVVLRRDSVAVREPFREALFGG
jgi:hypothetical protein